MSELRDLINRYLAAGAACDAETGEAAEDFEGPVTQEWFDAASALRRFTGTAANLEEVALAVDAAIWAHEGQLKRDALPLLRSVARYFAVAGVEAAHGSAACKAIAEARRLDEQG